MDASGLLALRRPAAVVLIGLIAVREVGAAAGLTTLGLSDPVPLLILTALVVWCAVAGDSAALAIAVAAFTVALFGLLLGVTAIVTAHPRAAWPLLAAQVLALVLPALCAVILAAALPLARQSAGRRRGTEFAGPAVPADPESAPAPTAESAQDAAESSEPPAGTEPVWRPDEASGAVWRTASDAASGAAASEWGEPGEESGWHRDTPRAGA